MQMYFYKQRWTQRESFDSIHFKNIEYIKLTHPHVEVIAGGGGIINKMYNGIKTQVQIISLRKCMFTPWKINRLLVP